MAAGSKNKLEILPEIQGKVLKAAREKMRYKPEDLAHKACLSKKHITNWSTAQNQGGGRRIFQEEKSELSISLI